MRINHRKAIASRVPISKSNIETLRDLKLYKSTEIYRRTILSMYLNRVLCCSYRPHYIFPVHAWHRGTMLGLYNDQCVGMSSDDEESGSL